MGNQNRKPAKITRFNEKYLFIQAFHLFKDARKEEKTNFIKSLNLYKQTLNLIDSIPEKFPASQLALRIAQRKVRIGEFSFKQLEKKILSLREKARKEELLTILYDCATNLRANDLKAEMLADLAMMFWKNQQPERALKILNEASSAIDNIEDVHKRNDSLNFLSIRYSEIQEFERALTLSAFFTELSDQIRLLTDLGYTYFLRKQRERAIQLFNNSIELVERAEDKKSRDTGLSKIAKKLGESREFFWAHEVCETIENSEIRAATLNFIASNLIDLGQLGNIQDIIEKVHEKNIRSELMCNLVSRYSAEGYFSQAKETADQIVSPLFKARALQAIARAYRGKNLVQIAIDFLKESVRLTAGFIDFGEQVAIIVSAAELFEEYRYTAEANQLIKDVIRKIAGHSDAETRSRLMLAVVKSCLKMGHLVAAEETLETIDPGESREKALVCFAIKLSELDRFGEAIAKLSALKDDFYRLRAFFELVKANPSNRNYRRKFDLIMGSIRVAEKLQNSDQTDQILGECVIFMAKFEKFHIALQTLEKIVSNDARDDIIWRLAQVRFDADFFNEGIEIMRLIMNTDKKISGLIRVGLGLLQGKYPDSTFGIGEFLPIAFSFWLEESEKISFAGLMDEPAPE